MANAYVDSNNRNTLTAVASDGSREIVELYADKYSHRLLVQGAVPNMTTVQKEALVSPRQGMIVLDTTLEKLSVYIGSDWETITSS